ncbi:ACP synthase [Myxococcus sp. CA039A]|uniref:ACP synthase n=1 Tax=Myxococcus sp. CA039A TaxID=2741737 RepID=UPI00157A8339|nr:ACP synthase [Myxococcus sp. CA039A]NTX55110.1 ACP synthase [Myxococcus sp. CA039A]
MSAHESEWTLRRLRAGELGSPEATRARAHAASCESCGAVLSGLESNQAHFEAALPFERFEMGVQRALERQQRRDALKPSPRRWLAPTVALAASVLMVVLARPLLNQGPGWDRSKGGADIAELRIGGGPGPQREVKPEAPEALEPGERVMLGYKAGTHRYVAAVSVDAIGEVTALHPESGASAPVESGEDLHWLQGSWEFTGSGAERVVLVLGDEPFTVESVVEATRRAFTAANGEVERMSQLDVPGAQTHWVLFKP